MELHFLARNKRHLQQVAKEDGIPMQEWFQKLIGGDGYSKEGGKLLAGNVNWKDIPDNKEVREWIKALIHTTAKTALPMIEGTITTKEFQLAFGKAKENTSSSPSGMDYTVCQCIAKDDGLAPSFVTMMRLPFQYGFVNKRWCKATDVMLEKKPGVRKIHQL